MGNENNGVPLELSEMNPKPINALLADAPLHSLQELWLKKRNN
jgi:hypothetical protein